MDGVDFDDDMGRNPAALPSLYDALKTKRPTTSQINVTAYEEFFLKLLQKGDLLHVTFSSGLSQSANNAFKAAENVAKMNLPHKLIVVDSLCGGGGYGLFVDGLLDERDKGATFETLCNRATERRLCVHHFFFSTDLTYFRRSGRVSGAVMLIGNLLKICPVMRVKEDGKIVAYTKAISSKKSRCKTCGRNESQRNGGRKLQRKTLDTTFQLLGHRLPNQRNAGKNLPRRQRNQNFRRRNGDGLPLRSRHRGNLLLGQKALRLTRLPAFACQR